MKILVCGTRGIPNILGGIETHCEHLYPLIVKKGLEITLVRRNRYSRKSLFKKTFEGVDLVDLYSPKYRSLESIIHSFFAVLYAKKNGFKFIHVHAIGPSLVIPLARLLGLRVLMTHHGPDYERQKWGLTGKLFLKLGEWCAAKFANEIIVISNTINKLIKEKYQRFDAHVIPNGVIIPNKSNDSDYLSSLGLKKRNYIIAIGRFVPEKGFHDLVKAFEGIDTNFKLVLVGDADHESNYSRNLKKMALEKEVILTGFIKGKKLNQIFSNAAMFIMPSYHEGLPIALLEAMSYNLKVVVSNIAANLEVDLDENRYFEVGNIDDLRQTIVQNLNILELNNYDKILKGKYNWDKIANQTKEVYINMGKIMI